MANANFPGSVWDGSSKTRKQTLDKEPPLQVYRSPDPDDWAQIAAEMVAPPWCYDSTDNKIYVYNGGWKATVALT